MNMKYLLSCCIMFFLASCNKEPLIPECPEQGDFSVDIPNSASTFPGSNWYYLTDQTGNIRDEKYATGFPVFLNWTDHCESSYTLNATHYSEFNVPGTGELIVKRCARSLIGLYNGQAFQGVLRPDNAFETISPSFASWTFNDIPALDSMMTLGAPYLTLQYTNSNGQLTVRSPDTSVFPGRRYAMICIRLAGEPYFRAVQLDLSDEANTSGTLTDFTEVVRAREISVLGEGMNQLNLSMLIDETNQQGIDLGTYNITEETVTLWVPETDNPFVLNAQGSYGIQKRWENQTVVEELLLSVSTLEEPLLEVERQADAFRLKLPRTSYIVINNNNNSLPILPGTGSWVIEGPLDAGDQPVKIPPVNPGYIEDYPLGNLSALWNVDVFTPTLTVHHFPTLSTTAAYWQVEGLTWRDQLTYSTVSIPIN